LNREQFVDIYERLSQTRTTFAECVKFKRQDGVTFRFTAHDKEVEVQEADGKEYTYTPANSFKLTALENNIGLAVSNMDIDAIIDDEAITENDLMSGKFEHAQVELFLVYWSKLGVGTLPLRTSWIGELNIEGASFRADLRGIAQRLAQTFINLTSIECRWRFCDSKCGLDVADYRRNVTVSSVTSQGEFNVSSKFPAVPGYFKWGLVTWTQGLNVGLSMEIMHDPDTSRLGLFLPMPYEIKTGDKLLLQQGCDKTFITCKTRFDNSRFFGGEPFLTGNDLLVSYKQSFGDADGGDE
jgi:uncharacterized phage protein (TIGR02218 family)